jgi:hypothetical protein
MRIMLLLVITILSGSTSSFCQADSLLTIMISKIKPSGKIKEIYFNPNRRIDLCTSEHKIMKLKKGYGITEYSLLYKTDTIKFENIIQLAGKRIEHEPKKVVRILSFVTGGTLMVIGLLGMAPRYGGSDDYNNWISYKTRFDKFRNRFFVGVAFTIGGIVLSNPRKVFETDKEWTIKKGYYKENNDGSSF